jgi:hypothetical protein
LVPALACLGLWQGRLVRVVFFKVDSLKKDFSNGLKNPSEKALSVGFFNPLKIF